MKIWDIREGRILYTLQGHEGTVYDGSFTKDGSFFSSAGADQLVMVWKSNFDSYMGTSRPEIDWSNNVELVEQCSPVRTDTSNRSRSYGEQSSSTSTLKLSKSLSTSKMIDSPSELKVTKTASASATSNQRKATSKSNNNENITLTLDHIVGQLDILTRTIQLLDERLTLTEDRVSSLLSAPSKENNKEANNRLNVSDIEQC